MKRKAQYALEYLLLVGFSFLLLIGALSILLGMWQIFQWQYAVTQAQQTLAIINEQAEAMASLAPDSFTTFSITLPSSLTAASVADHEVVLTLQIPGGGATDIVLFTSLNLTGTLPQEPGRYRMKIVSLGDQLWIGQ